MPNIPLVLKESPWGAKRWNKFSAQENEIAERPNYSFKTCIVRNKPTKTIIFKTGDKIGPLTLKVVPLTLKVVPLTLKVVAANFKGCAANFKGCAALT